MQQKFAMRLLKSGANVFLTGSAGCGKTHILNKYIRHLRAHGAKVAVTASTGIAATHLGGMTVHSWSGLGIRDEIDSRVLDAIAKKKPVRERVANARVLIIDEISMLSARTLECIDEILRHLKNNAAPFGGMQIIFSGDFFQLPPVNMNNDRLAFMAEVWLRANLKCCYLSESHRHADGRLLKFLSDMRAGKIDRAHFDLLDAKVAEARDGVDEDALKLHTHNVDVDAANARKLIHLPGDAKSFDAVVTGGARAESLKRSALAPEHLELKKHARVMFVKNNPDENYMNGTLGEVTGFNDDGWPIVKTADARIVARPVEWNMLGEEGETVASYLQVPLRLAWAITVHKSQGMTLARAAMDLSKTFEAGQGYVALSRVMTWDGLALLGYNRRALEVPSLVLKADARLRVLSREAEEELASRGDAEWEKMFARHIKACGGSLRAKKKIDELRDKKHNKKNFSLAPKPDALSKTKTFIAAGKTVAQIARARNLSESTIVAHIETLHRMHPKLDWSRITPPPKVVRDVCDAVRACRNNPGDDELDRAGNPKLTPLFRRLREKYAYDEIRLARIFCDGD